MNNITAISIIPSNNRLALSIKYTEEKLIKNLTLLLLSLIFAFFSYLPGRSQEISLSPLILYEQANAPLDLDGVSSGYKFGILGISGNFYSNKNVSTRIELGYAYVPSETVNFEGITFTGPISGLYLSGLRKSKIKKYEKSNLYFEQSISHRKLNANNLSGIRNGKYLLGTASTTINVYDALLGFDFGQNSESFISLSTGLGFWILSSKGSATNQSETITAWNEIKTNGVDPLLKLTLEKNFNSSKFQTNFQYRSLNSKLKSGITSISFNYEFVF